ncbi:TetR family transcriptional regulator [Actinocrispum sp. NPDC049592]|uniref:TetR/AcrR family transcriptional regulator n=1 Tax=Actinocrispum sp. NPDC049592 TaxID=3154835 RepID=UPI00343F8F6B
MNATGRVGRPPLTERRKAETRLEIAREAVRLFTEKGVSATSAEEIAAAAGLSLRTLWRYFPSKESCVLPLLTTGIDITVRCMRDWPREEGVRWLADRLRSDGGDLSGQLPTVVDLVRLTRTEPALRAVWIQAHSDAEPVFAAVLAERAGRPADDLTIRMRAGLINLALRLAIEHYTDLADKNVEPVEVVRVALLAAARGLPV